MPPEVPPGVFVPTTVRSRGGVPRTVIDPQQPLNAKRGLRQVENYNGHSALRLRQQVVGQ